jgi:hypothetical protein
MSWRQLTVAAIPEILLLQSDETRVVRLHEDENFVERSNLEYVARLLDDMGGIVIPPAYCMLSMTEEFQNYAICIEK